MIGFLAGFLGTALLTSRRTTTKNTASRYLGATGSTANVGMVYNSSNYNTYKPTDSIISFKKHVEGLYLKAYKHEGDPVTVGWGQTQFFAEDGYTVIGKPVKDKVYSREFLERQLALGMKGHYRSKAITIMKNIGLPIPQRIADSLYYLGFNGFVSSRGRDLRVNVNLMDRRAFANWLLTKYGIGPNFFVGSDARNFFAGMLTARVKLANYVMGYDINRGVAELESQYPKHIVKGKRKINHLAVLAMYQNKTLRLPYF